MPQRLNETHKGAFKERPSYAWHKQSMAPDLEVIDCLDYDPIKDFRRDPSGIYVLIRIDPAHALIDVAICNKNHVIVKVFRGVKSQDLYYTIFAYAKKYHCAWFTREDHIAYLGKELKKAELALLGENSYTQE